MTKDLLLSLAVTLVTLLVGIASIRFLMPSIFGAPADLQMVAVDRKTPPFYENIFSSDSTRHDDYLLNDPITVVRAPPFYPDMVGIGPNDVLGFRNRVVPNLADVVVIGDSQTYGNNAPLAGNWPSLMRDTLLPKPVSVYAMATGGWAAAQYLSMFRHSLRLRPRVVVIAFYTGNDPIESFQAAYNIEHWKELRTDHGIDKSAMSAVIPPTIEKDIWAVPLGNQHTVVFTPGRRFIANDRSSPVVTTGYDVMYKVASMVANEAIGKTQIVMTIIPTKELVYASRLSKDGIDTTREYTTLVDAESKNIRELSAKIAGLPGVVYVDLVAPMQESAMGSTPIYIDNDANGHPIQDGYAVIGRTIATAIDRFVPGRQSGLVAIFDESGSSYRLFLVNEEGVWDVNDTSILDANGWSGKEEPSTVTERDLAALPRLGSLTTIDPRRFGPAAMRATQPTN